MSKAPKKTTSKTSTTAKAAKVSKAAAPVDNTLRLGLPKGSLEESTFNLFAKAGYSISGSARGYRPYVEGNPFEVRLIRPQELSRYVHQGFLDAGITGKDWIAENESDVHVVCDLNYNKATRLPARWVLAVPEDSPFKTVKDLEGKRIATEPINLVKAYLKKHGVTAEVEFSWGATEVKVPELVDAIVDITETGSSIRANKLRIIDTIMESYPQFICSREAWKNPVKRKKVESIALLLNAALAARDKVGIKMNVPTKKLARLLKALPALRRPTISPLSDKGWVAVETILDERVVRDIIPPLKDLGAEGIIEYPLSKVVY